MKVLLGVCLVVSKKMGFNPWILRIANIGMGILFPITTLLTYLGVSLLFRLIGK